MSEAPIDIQTAELGTVLGEGTFGSVILTQRTLPDGTTIRVCEKTYKDVKMFAPQDAVREILMIKASKDHPCVVGPYVAMEYVAEPRTLKLVTTAYAKTLHDVCSEPELSKFAARKMCFQMFSLSAYLTRIGVLHRDWKPLNILSNDDHIIGLCDFGAAVPISEDLIPKHVYTVDYRPPEVAFQAPSYNEKADMWCIGAVMYCVLFRHLIFDNQTDEDVIEAHKLQYGLKNNADWASIEALNKKAHPAHVQRMYMCEDADVKSATQLMESVLQLLPRNRPSYEEVLSHPFFEPVRTTCKDEEWYKKCVSLLVDPLPTVSPPDDVFPSILTEVLAKGTTVYPIPDIEIETARRIMRKNESLQSKCKSDVVFACAAVFLSHCLHSDGYYDIPDGCEEWVSVESEGSVVYDFVDFIVAAGAAVHDTVEAQYVLLVEGSFDYSTFKWNPVPTPAAPPETRAKKKPKKK
eukprot:PhF_6_TR15042/c0_g1_i1/m.23606